MKKIQIDSPIGKLTGTLIVPENSQSNGKSILFLHGWLSSEQGYIRRAQVLANIGYTCLAFNLPGHRTSDGDVQKLTRKDYMNGVMAAYDFLIRQKGGDPSQVGVIGASFGGYLGVLLTKERSIKWLVMRGPANYPDVGYADTPQAQYTYEHPKTMPWRQKVLGTSETIALQAIHDFQNEILIIESENDAIVPHQSVQNYVDAAPFTRLTHIVMKGADHPLREEKHQLEFIQILVDWFKDK